MAVFIGRKVGAALIVVFLASVVVFAGARALPGDPALAYAAEDRDPEVLAAIRDKYGLDDPLPVQYVRWAGLALRGDLGTDSRGLPVAETVAKGGVAPGGQSATDGKPKLPITLTSVRVAANQQ